MDPRAWPAKLGVLGMAGVHRALNGVLRRPVAVLIACAVLTGLSLVSASRIQIKTSFWDTMSEDEPVIARIRRLATNFPAAMTAMVVLEGNEPDRLVEVARRIEQDLRRELEQVRGVYLEQDLAFFEQRALLYLPVDELRLVDEELARHRAQLAALVADPSLLGLLRSLDAMGRQVFPAGDSMTTLSTRVFANPLIAQTLAGRPGAELGLKLDTGPLRERLDRDSLALLRDVPLPPSDPAALSLLTSSHELLDLVADVLEQGERIDAETFHRRFAGIRSVTDKALPPRFQFSDDRRMLVMEVSAVHDVTRLEYTKPFVAVLERVAQAQQQQAQDVKIGLTGMPVLYASDERTVLDNFALVSILGLLGILAVFIIGFQQVALPSLAAIPLIVGVLWTLGLQGLARPQLNMFNLLFPVLLFGLGIDFAIHIINGFAQLRSQGRSSSEALHQTYDAVVPSLVTGALTTAAAFFAMLLASLKGVRELGFTAGSGVLLALLSMLLMLPALLLLWDRRRERGGVPVPHLEFVTMGKLGALLVRLRYAVLALFLVVTIVLAYFTPRVGLDRDAGRIAPQHTPAATLQKSVLEKMKMGLEPSVFFAADLVEAERIRIAASHAHTLSEPLSITAALPMEQETKGPVLDAIAEKIDTVLASPRATSPDYTEAELAELGTRMARLKRTGLELSMLSALLYEAPTRQRVGEIRDDLNRIDGRIGVASVERLRYLDRLIRAEVQGATTVLAAMAHHRRVAVEDLPRDLLERVQGLDGSWMVVVRANSYAFDEQFLRAHIEEMRTISPEFTGFVPVWHRMLEIILDDLPRLFGATLIAVALLVLLGLRSLRASVLSLVPLLVGLLWTVGTMGLLGLSFNVVSVLAVPLIVGIGIDNGVHLVHRIRHDHDVGLALAHTGKPILLTSLTTGIGFGSLLLSVHPGIFSLGLTTTLGILCCLLVSLLLVPALVAIFDEDSLKPATSPTDEP
ncbi:MAG: MMPL family transporter [Pseudomonadota bacterium]